MLLRVLVMASWLTAPLAHAEPRFDLTPVPQPVPRPTPLGLPIVDYRLAEGVALTVGPAWSYHGHEPGWDRSASLGLKTLDGVWIDGNYWSGEDADGCLLGVRSSFRLR